MKNATQLHTTPTLTLSVERQTHLVAGIIVLVGIVLTLTVNPWFIVMAALPGFGMLLDAATGTCPMTLLLKRMPWNAGGKR